MGKQKRVVRSRDTLVTFLTLFVLYLIGFTLMK
jgi:hypothetical protein